MIEDILRIYGYNNVEIPSRVRSTLSYAPKPDRNRLMNLAADYLSAIYDIALAPFFNFNHPAPHHTGAGLR